MRTARAKPTGTTTDRGEKSEGRDTGRTQQRSKERAKTGRKSRKTGRKRGRNRAKRAKKHEKGGATTQNTGQAGRKSTKRGKGEKTAPNGAAANPHHKRTRGDAPKGAKGKKEEGSRKPAPEADGRPPAGGVSQTRTTSGRGTTQQLSKAPTRERTQHATPPNQPNPDQPSCAARRDSEAA